MKKPVKSYLRALHSGNYEKILSHFNKGAVIFSPLYGQMTAADFYRDLIADTQASKIRLFDIFINRKRRKASCHFEYQWSLANSETATFECIDIFQFGENGKIDSLKIIYDTAETRKVFERL